ncbi:hypothetical protein [Mycoplasmopsis cynos]|uniref:hypothetical protein n=1 Tax=Mycoplasmopsis cynos TaxID=171284 RepID=UPI0012EA6B4D|nr:hypothetical protein [Mycoplasmopsis cynos]
MKKKKSRKKFWGLPTRSFLFSGITATSIFEVFIKNFSDYEKIYPELKKARVLEHIKKYLKLKTGVPLVIFLKGVVKKVF